MGFFFKALAAIVTADAIDRHARSRPTRYWYPNEPDLPPTGTRQPHASAVHPPAAVQSPRAGWTLERPERPD